MKPNSALIVGILGACACGGLTDDARPISGGESGASGGQSGFGGLGSANAGDSPTGGRAGAATKTSPSRDAATLDCGYSLGMSVDTSSLPDAKTLPECTVKGLCDAALSQSQSAIGCGAGPLDGYYVVNCQNAPTYPPSTSRFCLNNWDSLKSACQSGQLNAGLYENCNGFNVVSTASLHMIVIYYYDRNSGELVGQLAMTGIEGFDLYWVAGSQLSSGMLDTVWNCPIITCGP